jgi:hypothetical protein
MPEEQLAVAANTLSDDGDFEADGTVATHAAVTTSVHGITDTSDLVVTADLADYQPLDAVLTATTASFTTADETKLDGITAGADVTSDLFYARVPATAVAETAPRTATTTANLTAPTASARLFLVSIPIAAGKTCNAITFTSGATAVSAATNQWFALFDSSLAKLAVTADDTSTAWGTSAAKTLNLSAPFVTTYTGLYYVGICVVASTIPTLRGVSAAVNDHTGIAPRMCGPSTTGLTDPASCPDPAGAPAASGVIPYAYIT